LNRDCLPSEILLPTLIPRAHQRKGGDTGLSALEFRSWASCRLLCPWSWKGETVPARCPETPKCS